MQTPLFKAQTEWTPPTDFPDLSSYEEISIDLETKDPELKRMGSGAITGQGDVTGIAVAVKNWSGYYPIAHEGGGNMDRKKSFKMVSRRFEYVCCQNFSQCHVRCLLDQASRAQDSWTHYRYHDCLRLGG